MNYHFDREDLENLQFCIENLGVKEAFIAVNNLDHNVSIPVDDVVDFHQQFRMHYLETFGYEN